VNEDFVASCIYGDVRGLSDALQIVVVFSEQLSGKIYVAEI
jgi:hypothetical protein